MTGSRGALRARQPAPLAPHPGHTSNCASRAAGVGPEARGCPWWPLAACVAHARCASQRLGCRLRRLRKAVGTLGGAAGRVRAVQWVGWTVCKRRGLGRGGSGAAHTTLVVHQVPLRHIWHLHKWERSNRRMRYKLHWRLGRRGMYNMGWGHAGAPVPAFREPSQTLSALRCTIRHYAGTTIWVQGEPGGGRARCA